MILRAIRDLIRDELGWTGSNTFVGVIDRNINSVMNEYTGMSFYPQLYMPSVTVVATITSQQIFTLPSDLQHFLKDKISFSSDGTSTIQIRLRERSRGVDNVGNPSTFVRKGNTLLLWPFESVAIGGAIYLDYYRKCLPLAKDFDVLEIPELETTIRNAVVSKLARLDSTTLSKMAKADEQDSFSKSLGIQGSGTMNRPN